eukprot:1138873-Pelagomonas_calceolata.AAC.2
MEPMLIPETPKILLKLTTCTATQATQTCKPTLIVLILSGAFPTAGDHDDCNKARQGKSAVAQARGRAKMHQVNAVAKARQGKSAQARGRAKMQQGGAVVQACKIGNLLPGLVAGKLLAMLAMEMYVVSKHPCNCSFTVCQWKRRTSEGTKKSERGGEAPRHHPCHHPGMEWKKDGRWSHTRMHTHLVPQACAGACIAKSLYALVALNTQLKCIVQVPIKEAAQHQVVGSFLGVGPHGEKSASNLVGVKLQALLPAHLCARHEHVGVLLGRIGRNMHVFMCACPSRASLYSCAQLPAAMSAEANRKQLRTCTLLQDTHSIANMCLASKKASSKLHSRLAQE